MREEGNEGRIEEEGQVREPGGQWCGGQFKLSGEEGREGSQERERGEGNGWKGREN